MQNFLYLWQSAHSFVIKNFLIVLLIPLGIWGLSGNIDRPVFPIEPFAYESYDVAETASFSRGGGIAGAPAALLSKSSGRRSLSLVPDIQANDGFQDVAEEDRKIIKNANLGLQVDDPEVTRFEIEKKIKEIGGKIQNVNSWQVREGVLGYNLTTRIPSEKLEEALTMLGQMGEKTSESINSSDITRQYFDTKNQIKNLAARRDRVRKLLEFETESLSDILAVDRELTNVQNQLENLQNTQNRRDTDVNLSTLSLSIHPLPQIGDINNPYWSANKSWKSAVNNLIVKSRNLFDWALEYIVLAPLWIPALLILWWLKRKFWKRKKSKK